MKRAKSLKTKKAGYAASYNKTKEFEGERYTGMAVGRTHHWHYDRADWKEKKVTPEKWEFTYSTVKRRTGHAPEGSGVPVGTGYHWFILAHQFVEKLDANDYTTHMVGLKYKVAHKRADKDHWNASANAKRKHLIEILQGLVAELEQEPEQMSPIALRFDYKGKHYEATGMPVLTSCRDGICTELDITLNGKHLGIIRRAAQGWKMSELKPQGLVNALGEQILAAYRSLLS